MEFKIGKKEHWNIKKYGQEEHSLAKKLSDSLLKEMPGFLMSVVLFGSSARQEKTAYEKDIDVLLIVNDVSIVISPEVSQSFRVIVEKTAGKISSRFHINTIKLSNFWDYLRDGDPIGINMLRDGVPLFDTGIFEPAQQLLFQGRIRPTKEAVWIYWARAPNTIQNAKWHVLQAVIDLYWAAIDAAHAALMRIGETPPTPSHVADMLIEKFVKTGHLQKKYAETMRNLHRTAKMIAHRQIVDITGDAYTNFLNETDEFVHAMKKIIETE
ncbi:hypothetical protein JXB27_01140 [Candidatus Woesearchaeota archaeon]|nr:hypothetical protein [Candidatus Woesearchaeota archaeon]